MTDEPIVFAELSGWWPAFGQHLLILGGCALAYAAVAWHTLPSVVKPDRPRPATRGAGLALGAAVALLVLAWLTYDRLHPFLSLRATPNALELVYAHPLAARKVVPWRAIRTVVAGGGGGRSLWTHGCHLRLWLAGGGSLVSAHAHDWTRAQSEAARDRMDAMLQANGGGA